MAKKSFANPVVNELKGSAWFKRPSATLPENQSLPIRSTATPVSPSKAIHRLPQSQAEARPAKTNLAGVNTVPSQARESAYMHANIHAYMHTCIDEKATYSFAFRYPPGVLEKLEEVLHTVKTQHKRKLTKNVVAVAAMAFILSDFEANGGESLLYQFLVHQEDS